MLAWVSLAPCLGWGSVPGAGGKRLPIGGENLSRRPKREDGKESCRVRPTHANGRNKGRIWIVVGRISG